MGTRRVARRRGCDTTMRVRLAAAALTLATLASIVFPTDGIRFEPAARANLFADARVDDAPLARTHRPLIGVLSQPPYWEGAPAAPRGYIAASYVKWLETAGARAVPIWYDEPNATLDAKLAAVNGVLLPGGDSDVSRGTPLRATAERIVRAALDARDAGDYFPVWGTCMGFQLLALVVADDPLDAPLEPYDGANVASHLRVVERADRGRALGSLHEDVYAAATGYVDGVPSGGVPTETVYENHEFGVAPRAFEDFARLAETFGPPVATDEDRRGRTFAALVEGREGLPLYGAQFHPEKPAAEWDPALAIPHSAEAVAVGQGLANFFVAEARKSGRSPKPDAQPGFAEDDLVMANHATTFVGKGGYVGTHFDEIYVFGE